MPGDGPWSIEQAHFARIQSIAAKVNPAHLPKAATLVTRDDGTQIDGSTAVIRIMGPMERRLSYFGWLMGFASTDQIRHQVEAAAVDASIREA